MVKVGVSDVKPVVKVAILTLVLGLLVSGCNPAIETKQGELPPGSPTKSRARGKRVQLPIVARIEGMPSKEKSPEAIKKAIQSLSWVEPEGINVDFEDNSATFFLKQGSKLNIDELKKVVADTGQGKVVSAVRESNG
jgi:hypothetical protein